MVNTLIGLVAKTLILSGRCLRVPSSSLAERGLLFKESEFEMVCALP